MSLPQSVLEGKYEVVRPITEGGMGSVYLVRHLHLDELRVIKIIRQQYAEEKELQRRFLREARTAIRLRHPKIAQIFDFSISGDGTAHIIMEYIEGKTLQQLLRESGPPPLELTLDIAVQTLEALGYLHRKGYVHRDIAPDNVMLTRDFEGDPLVKLIDLGIAKRIGQEAAVNLTATGMFVGKARYSSPEQFGKGEMDQRSDLYSFGILLYELLTDRCPIEGKTLPEMISAHLFYPPLGFDQSDPEGRLPSDLKTVVMRALEKDAEQRMATAAEFVSLLEPIKDSLAPIDRKEFETTLRIPTLKTPRRPSASTQARKDIEGKISSARLLVGHSRFDEAREELLGILEIAPEHSEALRTLEMVEEILRHQQAAELQGAITKIAEEVERRLESGDLEAADQQLAEAIGAYGESEMFHRLQLRLQEAWQRSEADARREQAVLWLDEAESLLASGDLDGGEGRWRQVVDLALVDPDVDARQQRLKTEIERQRRERRRREEEERRAADRRLMFEARLEKAQYFNAQGDLEEARQQVRQALEIAPEDAQAAAVLASVEAALDQRREEEERQRRIERQVVEIRGLIAEGRLQEADKRLTHALSTFEGAGAWHPLLQDLERARHLERLHGLLERAREEVEGGDLDAARAAVREARELEPEHSEVRVLSAEIETARRLEEERLARQAARDSQLARIAENLETDDLETAGELLEEAGRTLEAGDDLAALAARLTEQREARREREIAGRVAELDELLESGNLLAAAEALERAEQDFGRHRVLVDFNHRLDQAHEEALQAEAAKLVTEAREALLREDLPAALSLLHHARDLRPADRDAQRLLSQTRDELQRREKEEQALAALAQIEAAVDAGDLAAARRHLDAAQQEHGAETFDAVRPRLEAGERAIAAAACLEQADALAGEGAFGEARSRIDEALRLEPENRRALDLQRQVEDAARQAEEQRRCAAIAAALDEIGDHLAADRLDRAGQLLAESRELYPEVTEFGPLQERLDEALEARAERRAARLARFKVQARYGLSAAAVLLLVVVLGKTWLDRPRLETPAVDPSAEIALGQDAVEQGTGELAATEPETAEQSLAGPPPVTEQTLAEPTSPSTSSPPPSPSDLEEPDAVEGSVGAGRPKDDLPATGDDANEPPPPSREASERPTAAGAEIEPEPALEAGSDPSPEGPAALTDPELTTEADALPTEPPASLSVVAGAWSEGSVTLDGRPLDLDRPVEVAAGTYQLRFSAPGHAGRERTVTLAPGSVRRLDFPRLSPLPAPSPPPPPEPTFERGDLITPGPGVVEPVKRSAPAPDYPRTRRRLLKPLRVVLTVLVDENGKVMQTLVKQGAPKGFEEFDRAAIRAAEKTTFDPATKDGVPGRMWAELAYSFQPRW